MHLGSMSIYLESDRTITVSQQHTIKTIILLQHRSCSVCISFVRLDSLLRNQLKALSKKSNPLKIHIILIQISNM